MQEEVIKACADPPTGHSIRLRFLILVAIALLPIAVLNIAQGWERLKRDAGDARALIQKATAAAADPGRNIILVANEKLRALAAQRQLMEGGTICARIMNQQLIATPYIASYLRANASGTVLCSANRNNGLSDLRTEPWWSQLSLDRELLIVNDSDGHISGRQRAIPVIRPLYSAAGEFDGALLAIVTSGWIDDLMASYDLPASAFAAILDSSGRVLLSNKQGNAAVPFRGNPAQFIEMSRGGFSPDYGARHWMVAVAPLVPNQYYIGLAMSRAEVYRKAYIPVLLNLILPILMILFASGAIWFGADFLIMRWLGYLQRTTQAYAGGHYAIKPRELDAAPQEFHALIMAIYSMADAIRERDRSLRKSVEIKAALLKETHHRIKNNLQIVMSLLNLQASRLQDPAARAALDQARIRINALALVHRILQETEDQTSVDMKELLLALASQLHGSLQGEKRELALKFDVLPMMLPTDVAIPLSLYAVEAMINAYTHGFPSDASIGSVMVSLLPFGETQLKFMISDTGLGYQSARGEGTGTRLINALALQVDGTSTIARNESGGTSVTLILADRRLGGRGISQPSTRLESKPRSNAAE